MKPIAAGAHEHDGRWVNDDTIALAVAAGWPIGRAGEITPLVLREPMAPHLAAAREGRSIELPPLLAAFERSSASAEFMVVEGVGGFRVPLARGRDTADLARAFALPVAMVVGMRLGCLNHALLTADAVAAAGLELRGWIANVVDPAMAALDDNVDALRERLDAPLLGRLPHEVPPEPRRLAAALDVGPLLK